MTALPPPENEPQPNDQGLFHNPAAIEELRHQNRLVENNYELMDQIEDDMDVDVAATASGEVHKLDQAIQKAVRLDPEGAAVLAGRLVGSADDYDRVLAGKLLLAPLVNAMDSEEEPWAGMEANLDVLARLLGNETSAVVRRWFNSYLFYIVSDIEGYQPKLMPFAQFLRRYLREGEG